MIELSFVAVTSLQYGLLQLLADCNIQAYACSKAHDVCQHCLALLDRENVQDELKHTRKQKRPALKKDIEIVNLY